MVNSADNAVTGFTAPDNNIGYGRVMADNVLPFPGDTKRLVAIDHQPGLGNGEYIEYEIQVTGNAFPLEVTLCWTDFPASPASSIQLVNDLNLTVTKGATVYKGNVYSGGASITGGSADSRNVEEACLISNPASGTWTVRIDGFAIPAGPQPFGLVVTGVVDAGSGALYLDRAEYGSTSEVEVQVIDTNASSPLVVHITSPTEPGGEDVTLTGGDGVFTGTLQLAPWSPGAPHGAGHLDSRGAGLGTLSVDVSDDTLRVSHGDQLTATYLDDSPAATLTARAFVAIEQPTITNVGADSRGSSSALIGWTTSQNASSTVHYGLTPALELGSLSDPTAVLSHQVLIPGLLTNATYYYDVESIGLNGNLVRDDNGGAHFQVTIDPPADILLVVGDEASFDRLEAWTEAAAAAGWSLDIWSGTLADSATLGTLTGGLRSYKAVIW
ncbi:MAG: APHP domain-containing protein, partial [bacterium]